MSDSLRVRLEFRRFNTDLRNSLFSFKRSETKDVKTLELIIKKRFQIQQPFCLNIDNFVLQQTEPIEILRDNDLIVVEPIFTASERVIKIEPFVEEEESPATIENRFPAHEQKPKVNNYSIIQTSSNVKRRKNCDKKKHKIKKSQKYVSDSDSSNDLTTNETKNKPNYSSKKYNITQIENEVIRKVAKSWTQIESKSKVEKEIHSHSQSSITPEVDIYSSRETPMRRAFLSSTTKNRPQIPKRTPKANAVKKPFRKRLTQEARDPVDEFSPIIILEKIDIKPKNDSNHIHINRNQLVKKQSARKSFPTPVDPIPKKRVENEKKEITESLETIDCRNCEPLTEIPRKGDIIAFKILTLSKDGNGYETSQFNRGSVLHVNKDTFMVDILLQNTIQKKNCKLLTNSKISEKLDGIHSIKINWSTVLEPKLIQRSSLLALPTN